MNFIYASKFSMKYCITNWKLFQLKIFKFHKSSYIFLTYAEYRTHIWWSILISEASFRKIHNNSIISWIIVDVFNDCRFLQMLNVEIGIIEDFCLSFDDWCFSWLLMGNFGATCLLEIKIPHLSVPNNLCGIFRGLSWITYRDFLRFLDPPPRLSSKIIQISHKYQKFKRKAPPVPS